MQKSEILHIVQKQISKKIKKLELLISETRASNNDTKSSMGDKYETGREMQQQEINQLLLQLNETLKQKESLKNIKTTVSVKVEKGALVETNNGLYYISESVGEISYNGQKIISISTESPLAKAMQNKIMGENFNLNQTSQSIKKIW